MTSYAPDLADQSEKLREYLLPSLVAKIEWHFWTYVASFYACFIHLQRVAYAHLPITDYVKIMRKKFHGPRQSRATRKHAMAVDDG
jgi:hypothetical protein